MTLVTSYAIANVIGSGTPEDPYRPDLVPGVNYTGWFADDMQHCFVLLSADNTVVVGGDWTTLTLMTGFVNHTDGFFHISDSDPDYYPGLATTFGLSSGYSNGYYDELWKNNTSGLSLGL